MAHKAKHTRQKRSSHLATLLIAVASGLLGTYLLHVSSAATTYSHDPDGEADYCRIENNNTVIYGWANDPDAPQGPLPNVTVKVGSVTQTVPSNIAKYRDAAVNAYINKVHPGQPTSGTYGWRAQYSGLYKGNTYVVSGTILNYGTGVNHALGVETTHYVDGNTANTFFKSDKSVPDACLATKPLPAPLPAPTPAPAPAPTPTPTKSLTPAFTSPADATVTAGTLHAWLQVPADRAKSIQVLYGTDPASLNSPSPTQTSNGIDALTVQLDDLQPRTTYSYTVVRTNTINQTATSPVATFTTTGYDAVLHFTYQGKVAFGITGMLRSPHVKRISNKQGDMTFHELDDRNYVLDFTYQNRQYSRSFSTAGIDDTSNSNAPTLAFHDNVEISSLTSSTVKKTAATAKSSGSPLAGIILTILILGGTGTGAWLFIRRRKIMERLSAPAEDTSPVSLGGYMPDSTAKHGPVVLPKDNPAEHIGQSLKDLVVTSMREETKRRKSESDKYK
jgi:hypothetical protein